MKTALITGITGQGGGFLGIPEMSREELHRRLREEFGMIRVRMDWSSPEVHGKRMFITGDPEQWENRSPPPEDAWVETPLPPYRWTLEESCPKQPE